MDKDQLITLPDLSENPLKITDRLPENPEQAVPILATITGKLLAELQQDMRGAFIDHQIIMMKMISDHKAFIERMDADLQAVIDRLEPLLSGERPEKNQALEEIAQELAEIQAWGEEHKEWLLKHESVLKKLSKPSGNTPR